MRINYNVSAMISNNVLANNDNALSRSLERLSSGLKINHGKDSPSGLAMAKRMNAQIRGLSTAGQNASDGVSIIETADGALSEVNSLIQRMTELSVKACNGTLTDDDRSIVQDEIANLKAEVSRIADVTEFNGQKLLNGEYAYKGYTDVNGISVDTYSSVVEAKEYKITSLPLSWDDDAKEYSLAGAVGLSDDFPKGCTVSVENNIATIKGAEGFEIRLDLQELDPKTTVGGLTLDITGAGPMRLQVGANEGQVLEINIPELSLRKMGIEDMDVSTLDGAKEAVSRLDGALSYVNSIRGSLGAYQNRLETTVESLDITEENMTAAYSRIMDVDMAEEMTEYSTAQVLTQAGTSMLAQANQRPSQILQLLQ